MNPDLSVLVCSVDTRYRSFALALQDRLWAQRNALPDPDRVEILILSDPRMMSIGRKRNVLVQAASGRYVSFVDDDDRLESNYVAEVLRATDGNADVITFPVLVSLGGGPERICKYDIRFERDYNTPHEFRRIPNHICAVRRDLALDTPYADINMGEDADYAKRLLPKLRSQCSIPDPLYHYDFDPRTSECRR